MQIGEGIVKLVAIMDEDTKCQYKPKDKKWNANLNGDSGVLADYLGNKPNANSEAQLTKTAWPSQAHHLIPHLTLKRHEISKWLKLGEKLYQDTYYNVDHKNNGKWMPYASKLPEWITGATRQPDKEKNRQLMFKIMGLANIQLHQSRHSTSNCYGTAESGYKNRVKLYLKKIKNNAVSHYAGERACSDCSGKKQSGKFPPRKNTVEYVDKASEFIEEDIDCCKIFVSRIAAEFSEAGGFDDN